MLLEEEEKFLKKEWQDLKKRLGSNHPRTIEARKKLLNTQAELFEDRRRRR